MNKTFVMLNIALIFVSLLTVFADQSAYAVPTFVGKGGISNSGNAITPSLPTGIQSGDVLILVVETANQPITITNAGSAGPWTQLTSSPQGTGTAAQADATRITVWYATYGGSGTTGPRLSDSGNHQIAEVFAFRNVDPDNPIGVSIGSTESISDTSASIPGATTTKADSLVVAIMGTALPDANGSTQYSGQSNPDLSDITEIEDITRNSGNGGGISVTTGIKTTIGSYGPTSVTTAVNTEKAMISLALNPKISVAPTLSISQPDGVGDTISVGDSYTITYTLSDPDDVVTASFYYDINNSGLDGTAISGTCATAAEGSDVTCTWDTTGMSLGNYYVYGITNDGTNPSVSAYSTGQITITVPSTTRLYFSASTTPSVNPNFDSWGYTAEAGRYALLSAKGVSGESLVLGTRIGPSATGVTQLDRQYVSEPMNAGQVFTSGSTFLKAQLQCREFNNGDNTRSGLSVRIVSQDGTTTRATLLTIDNYGLATGEFRNNNVLRNAAYADGDTVTASYTTVSGDRLVVEIGYTDNAGSTVEGQCRYGAPTGTDLPEDETTTTATNVPWIEFSNTITFRTGPDQGSEIPTDASTGTKTQRRPPQISGIGLYSITSSNSENSYSKIIQDDSNQQLRFEYFFPYSINSDLTDQKNYGEYFGYDKYGGYIPFSKRSDAVLYSTKINEPTQIQVRIDDEYASTKIEHVSLFIVGNGQKSESYSVELIFDKGKAIQVKDPQNFIKDVKVNDFLEDASYWVNFDLVFQKEIRLSDILLETWHEGRNPAYALFVGSIKATENMAPPVSNTTLLTAKIEMTHDTSSPICKASNTCFVPNNVTILKNGIVTWHNPDSFIHDVTSGTPNNPDNRFDLHVMPGETKQKSFNTPGIYKYFCSLHPWATGSITVVDSQQNTIKEYDEAKPPIIIASVTPKGSVMIEQNQDVIKNTKDMKVEISGNIQEGSSNSVTITIIRPDGTSDDLRVLTNDRGYYFIPTNLNKKWLEGDYVIITKYNGVEIGQLKFTVKQNE